MNDRMWLSAVTQRNVKELAALGVRFVGPVEGRLASGKVAVGHLAPVPDITGAATAALGKAAGPSRAKTGKAKRAKQ